MIGAETAGDRPIVNIVGERIALGPPHRDLLPTYQRWLNDFATLRTLALPPQPMTLEQETSWYDHVATAPGNAVFTIYEAASLRPLGTTGLHDIDHRHRTAEFGIFIGEATERGKGYGTETARLMLDYAFTALGLHNVMLQVYSFNLAGQRAYAKAGFREFGRRRACHRLGPQLYDVLYLECLASEFASPVLARVFQPDAPRA